VLTHLGEDLGVQIGGNIALHVEFPGCAPDIHGTGVGEDGAMDLDIAIL
jgi:hypothetical protein